MRFAILSHSLPQPSSNGGPMTCWGVLQALRARGHDVTVIALRYSGDSFQGGVREAALRRQGADVVHVDVPSDLGQSRNVGITAKLRRLGNPTIPEVFPTARLAERTRAALREARPAAAFLYHWDTVAAAHGVRDVPKIAGVGDPWHLPEWRRWQHSPPQLSTAYATWTAHQIAARATYPSRMVALLNDCEAAGSFQAGEARWLRARGARMCDYWPSPIDDVPGPEWRERRAKASAHEKPTILVGPSNLEATSTRAGLAFLAKRILPRLEQEMGKDGFVIRIVGEGTPPPELARLLPRPSVVLPGRVEPADDELLRCDIQLVPTPFVLGVRVRIITGLSFGCSIVAHESERHNLPELEHGVNALVGNDGPSLAQHVARALGDPALRASLSEGARRTFERTFTPATAARPIVDAMERAAGIRAPTTRSA